MPNIVSARKVLTPEHRAADIDITEDDHTIVFTKGGRIARLGGGLVPCFNATKVTLVTLRHTADQILEASRNGVEFVRVK